MIFPGMLEEVSHRCSRTTRRSPLVPLVPLYAVELDSLGQLAGSDHQFWINQSLFDLVALSIPIV
jgi:hypothetical protein